MKIQNKIALAAASFMVLSTSCANNDLIPDMAEVGQAVPTCYWEVGSTTCKAGESFTFQGKYTVEPGVTPDRSEVWYRIIRQDDAVVTATLTGSTLAYQKSVSITDTMRTASEIAKFPHNLATWDGHEYIIQGAVPVSRTLTPLKWAEISEWNQERFDSYYPDGFAEEFCSELVTLLTKDSTHYNAVRAVYLNYPFPNEQMAEMNAKYNISLPDAIDLTQDDKGSGDKSKLWYTSEIKDSNIVGYYYIETTADGVKVYKEVAKDYVAPEGVALYPVYDSSSWLFSRYDDDLGQVITTVRPAAMAAFKELFESIAFTSWIYGAPDAGTGNVYKVNFNRKYSLESEFRVYDTDSNEGIAYDKFIINVN